MIIVNERRNEDITQSLENNSLIWFGYLIRMGEKRRVKNMKRCPSRGIKSIDTYIGVSENGSWNLILIVVIIT